MCHFPNSTASCPSDCFAVASAQLFFVRSAVHPKPPGRAVYDSAFVARCLPETEPKTHFHFFAKENNLGS